MNTKALTAAQIDTLALRLSETPVGPSATAKKAGDNFARLLAAVEIARQHPPDIRRGDALVDLPSLIDEIAADLHPVVTNSWVLSYFSADERREYVDLLDRIGGSRDLSWVIAESPRQTPELPVPTTVPAEDVTVVSVVTWRGGERTVRRLATAHPHGYWLHWQSDTGV